MFLRPPSSQPLVIPSVLQPRHLALPLRLWSLVLLVPAASALAEPPLLGGNPGRGEVIFQQSCALCHDTGRHADGPGGPGPQLAGVVGRSAGSLSNYNYTPALLSAHLTWDADTLNRFLAAPSSVVPGSTMLTAVPETADRRDLISFLATLRAVPASSGTGTIATVHTPGPGDWQNDAPGRQHRIDPDRLPLPYATQSAGNHPRTLAQPEGATLAVPAGFSVQLVLSGLAAPRLLRAAPNGDLFIAESAQGRIRLIRLQDGSANVVENRIFATNLQGPFGIAFYPLTGEPQWLYVANLNSVVRFPYRSGDLTARAPAETVLAKLSDGAGGHNTRDLAFSVDGQQMFISVGSASNAADGMPAKTPDEVRSWAATHPLGLAWDRETNRACILRSDPAGRELRVYATGLRNAVGIAVQPETGRLWASVNERDGLGDDLVPDYITRVQEGGFYGWPWYYLGDHEDPRFVGTRPDLAGHILQPDVLLQAHSAALQLTFYPRGVTGPSAFPEEYQGDAFVALHGSWNRAGRTGGKVIRVRLRHGQSDGSYEDFLTGFVIDDTRMWGRPVGLTVARDGALLVTDDANGTLWRVSYHRD